MILHTVNKSPFTHQTLWDCLAIAKPGDIILLLEDGVYGALDSQTCSEAIKHKAQELTFYALQPHLEARGIQDHINDSVCSINYVDFVELCTKYPAIQSWF